MTFGEHLGPRGRLVTALCACLAVVGGAGMSFDARSDDAVTHGNHSAQVGDQAVGTVDFRVSCAESSRASFDRALAYMHHMMYEQARAGFAGIIDDDPQCAMARWGIATTLFQPLWPTRPSVDDLKRGWTEIQEAQADPPATDRERLLLSASEAFFREPETADWWTRIRRWGEAMAVAYRAAPRDLDVAALYGLSRLALAPVSDRPAALHDEAESVLRAVFEQEPRHPGAVHYTVHANDATGRADRALDIVRSYSDIAPEVPHALHMPTHIFVRLGEWPEVIEWNRRSADAALKHPAGDAISHHYPHATDYLAYALLQQGEDQRAKAVVDETLSKVGYQRSFISAFHLASIPARYAVERREWAEAAALEPRTPGELPWDNAPWAEGLTWLARGLGALHKGDLDRAQDAEARLAELRDAATAAEEAKFATYIEIDRLILAGWMARAGDDANTAVDLIRAAGQLEDTVEKHPVTPGALLPPREALGDLLLSLNRPAEALAAYQASNAVWPARYNTLLGAARAAATAGDEQAASTLYAELMEVAGNSARPGVAEARRYLTQ